LRIERHIDQRRRKHAAQCARHWQRSLARIFEWPLDRLALQFQSDIKEEHDHQAVIDDEMQIDRMRGCTKADRQPGDLILKQMMESVPDRAVQQQERQQRRGEQNEARRGVALQPMLRLSSRHSCSHASPNGPMRNAPRR